MLDRFLFLESPFSLLVGFVWFFRFSYSFEFLPMLLALLSQFPWQITALPDLKGLKYLWIADLFIYTHSLSVILPNPIRICWWLGPQWSAIQGKTKGCILNIL